MILQVGVFYSQRLNTSLAFPQNPCTVSRSRFFLGVLLTPPGPASSIYSYIDKNGQQNHLNVEATLESIHESIITIEFFSLSKDKSSTSFVPLSIPLLNGLLWTSLTSSVPTVIRGLSQALMELCVAPVASLAVHQWPLEPTKKTGSAQNVNQNEHVQCSKFGFYIYWTIRVSMIIMDRNKRLYPRILFYSPTKNNHSFGYALGLTSKYSWDRNPIMIMGI